MSDTVMRKAVPSKSSSTTPSATPAKVPVKALRLSSGDAVFITAVLPANRAKCYGVRSGRSMPGDETSSV